MTRFALLAAALVVSACAPGALVRAPAPPPREPIGPEVVVRIPQRGQAARDLLEQVAARCWLDGVLRGAQMIVDRQTGRIVIVGDTEQLLAGDFMPPQGGRTRIRLSGPAVADRSKADRLVSSLDLAVRTGETSCPMAAG